MAEVMALIPARSGSKSVPHKNIREIDGKPMLVYSIEHALASKYINKVIVSTDSEEYAEIARAAGAEVPFIRPQEYATDTALDIDVFCHALTTLKSASGYIPDLVVQLRPTYPIREVSDIDNMIRMMLEDESIDSVRTVAPAKEIAHKMWCLSEDGLMQPILKDIPEAYNMPRQQLPKIMYQNACIDVVRSHVILKQHSMSGKKIAGYQMSRNFDIDAEDEFRKAAEYLKIKQGGRRFVFDIDGVIAGFDASLDYAKAGPNKKMINIVNRLYELGNEIVLFTARGYVTGIDWQEVTRQQMQDWGVRYHELIMGKPNADYYIDDKMLSLDFLYEEFG